MRIKSDSGSPLIWLVAALLIIGLLLINNGKHEDKTNGSEGDYKAAGPKQLIDRAKTAVQTMNKGSQKTEDALRQMNP